MIKDAKNKKILSLNNKNAARIWFIVNLAAFKLRTSFHHKDYGESLLFRVI